jgi:uncharacterized damage-inducible protein DinB
LKTYMNDGLIDGFRHNTWATRQVLVACQDLTERQLEATAIRTFGCIIATLRHLDASEAGYCARPTGEEIAWHRRAAPPANLEELSARVEIVDALGAFPWDAVRR